MLFIDHTHVMVVLCHAGVSDVSVGDVTCRNVWHSLTLTSKLGLLTFTGMKLPAGQPLRTLSLSANTLC